MRLNKYFEIKTFVLIFPVHRHDSLADCNYRNPSAYISVVFYVVIMLEPQEIYILDTVHVMLKQYRCIVNRGFKTKQVARAKKI